MNKERIYLTITILILMGIIWWLFRYGPMIRFTDKNSKREAYNEKNNINITH